MTILEDLRGGLIVSVQVHRRGDPLDHPAVLARIARSVVGAGAVGIRCGGPSGPASVRAIARSVDVPVIGLWKVGDRGVYITPTVRHAVAVARAGADIVAVDGTRRARPRGETLEEVIAAIHAEGRLAMADLSAIDDMESAVAAGADLLATTLAGYVGNEGPPAEPDILLVSQLRSLGAPPVVAEGRFEYPHQARAAFDAGAHAVVVGRAITAPGWITDRFLQGIGDATGS